MATEAGNNPLPDPTRSIDDRPNRTRDSLVKYRADCSPLPSHCLVVCKRIGNGNGYSIRRAIVPAGKLFKWFLHGRRQRFFAYAVPQGTQQLALELSFNVASSPTIDLSLRATYTVNSPVRLINRLLDDPLEILKAWIKNEIPSVAQSIPWVNLRDAGAVLERFSLPFPAKARRIIDGEEAIEALYTELKEKSAEFGLRIEQLIVSRRLSALDSEFVEEKGKLINQQALQPIVNQLSVMGDLFQQVRQRLSSILQSSDSSEALRELKDLQLLVHKITDMLRPLYEKPAEPSPKEIGN